MPRALPATIDNERNREAVMREALSASNLEHGADSILVANALRSYSYEAAFEGSGETASAWALSDLAEQMAVELEAKIAADAASKVAA